MTLHVEREGKKRLLEVGLIRSAVALVKRKKELYDSICELGVIARH